MPQPGSPKPAGAVPRTNQQPATAAALITAKLKGQSLKVPDFREVFARWPSSINPHHDELAEIVNKKFQEWIPDDMIRQSMIEFNMPFFSSTWHPAASLEALLTFTLYNAWLFIWDDAFEGEATTRMSDVRAARLTRETLDFLAQELGLTARTPTTEEGRRLVPYKLMFGSVGDALRLHGRPQIAQRFYDELVVYVDGCAVERLHVKHGTLPSVRDYWDQRLGSSSLYACCALADYMVNVELPESFFGTEELKTMWFETNRNVCLVNDVLSFRKELKHSAYSLVPVTMNETGQDLDAIVTDLMADTRQSMDNFDRAAEGLLTLCGDDARLRQDVKTYADAMRTNMTGNVVWSLAAERYGIQKCGQEDGSLVIPL